ncbi:MAG: AAA family ATPase [Gemmatimonadaceae bacterium]
MKGNGTKAHTEEQTGAGRIDSETLSAIGRGSDEPAPSLQSQVQRAMLDDSMKQKETAAQIGIGVAVLNQWLQSKYSGDVSKVDQRVMTWLRARGERVEMQHLLPTAPTFFESQTAMLIIRHLRVAQTMQDMLTVFGVPGVGKTTAVHHYQRAYPNVWVVTFSSAVTGVMGALTEMGEAMQAGARGNSGARARMQSILAKVRNTNGLIVIDEAHHLGIPALDAIRSIHDASGVGIALVGGPKLELTLQHMPQFYSRVGLKLFVTKVLQGDIDAQLEAWNINKRDARTFLTQLAQKPGALRGVNKTLRLASMMAASEGGSLDVQHIKDAAATLGPQATGEDS